jgi:hypothetical protein
MALIDFTFNALDIYNIGRGYEHRYAFCLLCQAGPPPGVIGGLTPNDVTVRNRAFPDQSFQAEG